MKVVLVCPAPPRSRLGNRITALRWQAMLRALGHDARIVQPGASPRCDVLVALHARRSAASVQRARKEQASARVVVALTGTDLYRDIRTDAAAQESLRLADRLVALHPGAARELPRGLRDKLRVVPQSAARLRPSVSEEAETFDVAVVGHLRAEKDPLRTALAARLLPAESRVRVLAAGGALSEEQAEAARREMEGNPRYTWLGELSPGAARGLIAGSRLLAITSEMEGGANVVSEAIASSTPVIASRIPALQAILGGDYPGLFRYGDTRALARLLRRAEEDARFLADLRRRCVALQPAYSPRAEKAALRSLMGELRGR